MLNEPIPLQTESIRVLPDTPISFVFPVTFDENPRGNIVSAKFVIRQSIRSTNDIANVDCTVFESSLTANVGTLLGVRGSLIGELSITLGDGNIYTPLQFGIEVL